MKLRFSISGKECVPLDSAFNQLCQNARTHEAVAIRLMEMIGLR